MSARNLMIKERHIRRKIVKPANDGAVAAGYAPGRWICHHYLEGSNIEAYVAATCGLEIIAQTRATEGIDARANAERIVNAVNAYEKTQPLIAELAAALELCLACDAIEEKTRGEAKLALSKARGLL